MSVKDIEKCELKSLGDNFPSDHRKEVIKVIWVLKVQFLPYKSIGYRIFNKVIFG